VRTASTDLDVRPFVVIWEVTRACDLACLHCRAAAQSQRSRFELSTEEGVRLIDQIADLGPEIFVMTGGDPLKRPDLYQLIAHSRSRGLQPALTPSATPLLTHEEIDRVKEAGVVRLAVSLDGSTAEIHDAFRGIEGSFDRTIDAIRYASSIGLLVQINTTVARRNLDDMGNIAALIEELGVVMWSVFFLVPTGRGKNLDMITAEESEKVFELLYEVGQRAPFDVKTTEAMHYRRYVIQQRMKELGVSFRDLAEGKISLPALFAGGGRSRGPLGVNADGATARPRGVSDARGFVFISHIGEVYPSGFLPRAGGNVRKQTLAEIYRDSPLFVSLRDSSLLEGKCGVCGFREICGGSRARAYATTGNIHAEDTLCAYQPHAARG
jgi:AdoMet-dependent heme synthase